MASPIRSESTLFFELPIPKKGSRENEKIVEVQGFKDLIQKSRLADRRATQVLQLCSNFLKFKIDVQTPRLKPHELEIFNLFKELIQDKQLLGEIKFTYPLNLKKKGKKGNQIKKIGIKYEKYLTPTHLAILKFFFSDYFLEVEPFNLSQEEARILFQNAKIKVLFPKIPISLKGKLNRLANANPPFPDLIVQFLRLHKKDYTVYEETVQWNRKDTIFFSMKSTFFETYYGWLVNVKGDGTTNVLNLNSFIFEFNKTIRIKVSNSVLTPKETIRFVFVASKTNSLEVAKRHIAQQWLNKRKPGNQIVDFKQNVIQIWRQFGPQKT